MKAIVYTKYGPPDVLQLKEVEKPAPKDNVAQNIFLPLITPIIKPVIGNKKTVFPTPIDIRGSILLMKKLIEEGKFKAVIDRKYPLEQIVEAYKYVETGQKTGNVVITVEHNSKG